jgi:hypothetical protein
MKGQEMKSKLNELAKQYLKPLIPKIILNYRSTLIARKMESAYKELAPRDVFAKVYCTGAWGKQDGSDFFSGRGSNDPTVMAAYVNRVTTFIAGLHYRPKAVDLGCGDFSVGRHLVSLCSSYAACDIVPELIERNRTVYADLDVDFKCLNIIEDDLPDANIAIIRQVFQHLSNRQISAVLPKLKKYEYLLVTEHLPRDKKFTPNLDKPAGPGTRLGIGSGIVLTAAPFRLATIDERVLCVVEDEGGLIQTKLYSM